MTLGIGVFLLAEIWLVSHHFHKQDQDSDVDSP